MAPTTSPFRIALAGFIALVAAMGIGRFAFTPLLPVMVSDQILDVAGGGVLASIHFLGYAMGAFLAGYVRTTSPWPLAISLVAIAASTGAMGLTDSYAVWLVSRWAAGVFSALVLVFVSNTFVARLAVIDRQDLQGLVFAGVGGGIALAGLVTLGLMAAGGPSWTGWQWLGMAASIATAVVFLLDPARSQQKVVRKPGIDEGHSNNPLAWRIIVPYGAMGAGYIIPATYLPIMAQQTISSPLIFGWSWPIFGVAAAVSTVFAARLYGRYTNLQLWVPCQAIMAVGLLLPVVWNDIVSIALAGVCVGGTFMVITMTGLKEAHRVSGGANPQKHIAAMTAAFAIGQMIGPALAAWAYELTQSFDYPLIIASVVLLLTIVPLLRTEPAARHAS